MSFDDLRSFRMCYLASPYSKYPGGLDQAHEDICRVAARLLVKRIRVYSPIAHGHAVTVHGGLDALDAKFWMEVDEGMMSLCDCLLVVTLPGWEDSKGICDERRYFRRMGKPERFLNPTTLEISMPATIGTPSMTAPPA